MQPVSRLSERRPVARLDWQEDEHEHAQPDAAGTNKRLSAKECLRRSAVHSREPENTARARFEVVCGSERCDDLRQASAVDLNWPELQHSRPTAFPW